MEKGFLEVFYGTMGTGKSKHLVDRLNVFDGDYVCVKPACDSRDDKIFSRARKKSYNCFFVDEKKPYDILGFVDNDCGLLVIDEAQFFASGIEGVVDGLLSNGVDVSIAGLDLDFKAEPFGMMGELIAMADKAYPLPTLDDPTYCMVDGCDSLATRGQLFYDGKPAPYDLDVGSLVGDFSGEKIRYESRCVDHHVVPGKP